MPSSIVQSIVERGRPGSLARPGPSDKYRLVADISAGRRSIAADDTEVDLAVLHEMAARVIDDHRVRYPVVTKLPGGQRSALISRPSLVNPDMNRDSGIESLINRSQSGYPIDRC